MLPVRDRARPQGECLMSVDFEITQLAADIRSVPRTKRTDAYPASVVHRTLALAKRLCPHTYSHNQLAKYLGLSPKTVTNWLAAKPTTTTLVPVLVSPPPNLSSHNHQARFCLLGPCGTHIDNLSVEQLASLLKALS